LDQGIFSCEQGIIIAKARLGQNAKVFFGR
jgi:hypothetical protein